MFAYSAGSSTGHHGYGDRRPEQLVGIRAEDVGDALVDLRDGTALAHDEEAVLHRGEVRGFALVQLLGLGDVDARADVAEEPARFVGARLAPVDDAAIGPVGAPQPKGRFVPARAFANASRVRVEAVGAVVGVHAVGPTLTDLVDARVDR